MLGTLRNQLEDTNCLLTQNTMKLSKSVATADAVYIKTTKVFFSMVEMTGIEPVTCGLQSHRSPN